MADERDEADDKEQNEGRLGLIARQGRGERERRQAQGAAERDEREMARRRLDAAVRVDLERAIRWLSAPGPTYRSASRAWNTAVSLSESDERSPSTRRRLKYARRQLRRSQARAYSGPRCHPRRRSPVRVWPRSS